MSLNTPHLDKLEDTETTCLRCKGVLMKDAGEAILIEGESQGALKGLVATVGELTSGVGGFRSGAPVDVYVCPKCGKVELFG